MLNARRPILRSVLVLGTLLTLSRAAEAGPPLICHPFDAGTAALLPWGSGPGWNTPDPSYNVQQLTADTLRLLSADAPILARMENLRRATIYAEKNPQIAAQLLAAVHERAVTAAGDRSRDPLPWFDAGYLIESYRQLRIYRDDMIPATKTGTKTGTKPGDGYALVQKAIDLSGSNPTIEFAASLMKEGSAAAEHRRRAQAGAPAGSLLAKNIAKLS